MGSDLKYLVFSRCLWRGRVPHLKYLYLYLYLLLYLYLWRGKCPTAPSEIFVIVFVFVARKSAPSEIFEFLFVARKSAPSEMMILNVSFEILSIKLYTFGSFLYW